MISDDFCPECGVTLDLHPKPYDPDDTGCDTAAMKVRVLRAFDDMIERTVHG